jgi:hypothetical protein
MGEKDRNKLHVFAPLVIYGVSGREAIAKQVVDARYKSVSFAINHGVSHGLAAIIE